MMDSLLMDLMGVSALTVLVAFILKVVLCIVVYLIGRKLIGFVIKTVVQMMTHSNMQQGAVTFAASILKIALYCVLVAWIAMQFGVEETSVAALVASAGVAVGLALQGGLSNLVGGFLILWFQPFKIGDYVITQGVEGTVQRIEIMYTTLTTVTNQKIIVPNGNLANNVIVNNTGTDRRMLNIQVGISYNDDIDAAKAVLEELVNANSDIMRDEPKNIFVSELGESSIILGLRCWVTTDNYFPVLWQLNENIKKEFDKAGIHIPYPQMDVHVVK